MPAGAAVHSEVFGDEGFGVFHHLLDIAGHLCVREVAAEAEPVRHVFEGLDDALAALARSLGTQTRTTHRCQVTCTGTSTGAGSSGRVGGL